MDTPAYKRCSICHEEKPLAAFGILIRSKDGHRCQCLECRKRVYEANKAKHQAGMARYRANRTPEQKAAKVAKDAAYYQDNKEKWPAHAQKRRDNHPEELHAYHVQYYADHKEQSLAHSKAWRKAHPKERQAEQERRRARKANAERNDLTHAQWLEIQEAQKHRCYYCGKRCKGHLTQDHILPFVKGGSHTLHNVIAACNACNSKKGTRKPPIPVQPFLLTIAPAKPLQRRSA